MIYNIFSRSKREKIKAKTPKIIADIHEKNSLILAELKKSTQVRLEIRPLKIADYLIGDVAIERKTISDLISSMINKRLIQQLKQMQKYKKQLLIIEGNLKEVYEEESNISKAIRGFIISINLNYKIPIIFSEDYEDTAKYLITLAKQQAKPSSEPSLHSKIPRTIKEQKQYILESFPNIGPKTSKKLLEKFPNLLSIFNSSEQELKEVLKSKTKSFKEILED